MTATGADMTPLNETSLIALGASLPSIGSFPDVSPFEEGLKITNGVTSPSFGETSFITLEASLPSTSFLPNVSQTRDSSYGLQLPSCSYPFPINTETTSLSDSSLRVLSYLQDEKSRSGMSIAAFGPTLSADENFSAGYTLVRIRDRWINPLFKPSSRTLSVNRASAGFMTHVLKSYPKMMVREGRLPPIIHRLQSTPRVVSVPLTNCLGWTKMWEHRTENSEGVLLNAMQGEFGKLYQDVWPPRLSQSAPLIIYSSIVHTTRQTC